MLVGHSYGGAVISEAGNHPRVSALVYCHARMRLLRPPHARAPGHPHQPPEQARPGRLRHPSRHPSLRLGPGPTRRRPRGPAVHR
ncbi:hypothetical protein ABT061_07715 [Streptosporangium sp. NPDC002544]|uniref:hypothetical protein n=1 Tax=Streptosporangium sp. NPDC002544 TaxID=3154538 RepID=UPI003329C497